jgi:Putative restriction endonuclease
VPRAAEPRGEREPLFVRDPGFCAIICSGVFGPVAQACGHSIRDNGYGAAYYSTADAARIDLKANRVLGVPTLVVEVVSEDDEERDTVTKREEYAAAGIQHYWILDPRRRAALLLALRDGRYGVAGDFSGQEVLTSELFPGLAVPLSRLFRSRRGAGSPEGAERAMPRPHSASSPLIGAAAMGATC